MEQTTAAPALEIDIARDGVQERFIIIHDENGGIGECGSLQRTQRRGRSYFDLRFVKVEAGLEILEIELVENWRTAAKRHLCAGDNRRPALFLGWSHAQMGGSEARQDHHPRGLIY